MPPGQRLRELQIAMNKYGAASGVILTRQHMLGNEIVRGFERFLGEGACVVGVPPVGDWNPDQGDYREAKFSDFGQLVLIEPVFIGVAIRIPHEKDAGELWLRVVLKLEPKDSEISVWAGDHEVRVSEPSNAPRGLEPVYELMLQCAKEWFEDPMRAASDTTSRSIGFVSLKDSKLNDQAMSSRQDASASHAHRRHPAFGAMKGMTTIPPGVDLTEPAMPEWAELIDEKYGKGP